VLGVAATVIRAVNPGDHPVTTLLGLAQEAALLLAVTNSLRIPADAVLAIALFGALDVATDKGVSEYYLPQGYLVRNVVRQARHTRCHGVCVRRACVSHKRRPSSLPKPTRRAINPVQSNPIHLSIHLPIKSCPL
jgi:hypothetical protein